MFINSHIHLVDFNQETTGLKKCLSEMKKASIDSVVISGLPLILRDKNYYYFPQTDTLLFQELNSLKSSEKNKFFPLLCGFNPNDQNAYQYIEKMLNLQSNTWHGLGEIIFRHGLISSQTKPNPAKINHPAMKSICSLTAERELPILIHQNLNSRQGTTYKHSIDELKKILNEFKETVFILAHAGTAQLYNPDHYKIIRLFLKNYPNLYIELSWNIFDNYIFRGKGINNDWLGLIKEYSGRFCLGSDSEKGFRDFLSWRKKCDLILDKLSQRAKKELAFKVAYNIYSKKTT